MDQFADHQITLEEFSTHSKGQVKVPAYLDINKVRDAVSKDLSRNNFVILPGFVKKPPPAPRHPQKHRRLRLFRAAGGGQRVAFVEMWKLFKDSY